jgi:hypothetical protein
MAEVTTNGAKTRRKPRRKSAAAKRRAGRKASSLSALNGLNGNARAMIEHGASSAYRQGRRMAKRAYSAAGDAMRDVRLPDRHQLESFVEHNPLMLGAVGLGLGVVIGTLLPRYSQMMPSAAPAPRRTARGRKR